MSKLSTATKAAIPVLLDRLLSRYLVTVGMNVTQTPPGDLVALRKKFDDCWAFTTRDNFWQKFGCQKEVMRQLAEGLMTEKAKAIGLTDWRPSVASATRSDVNYVQGVSFLAEDGLLVIFNGSTGYAMRVGEGNIVTSVPFSGSEAKTAGDKKFSRNYMSDPELLQRIVAVIEKDYIENNLSARDVFRPLFATLAGTSHEVTQIWA